MKHRRVLYTNLETTCGLTEHLAENEEPASRMVKQTVRQMAQTEGVKEQIKADDPLRRTMTGAGTFSKTPIQTPMWKFWWTETVRAIKSRMNEKSTTPCSSPFYRWLRSMNA